MARRENAILVPIAKARRVNPTAWKEVAPVFGSGKVDPRAEHALSAFDGSGAYSMLARILRRRGRGHQGETGRKGFP
jgi:hypothetical protein